MKRYSVAIVAKALERATANGGFMSLMSVKNLLYIGVMLASVLPVHSQDGGVTVISSAHIKDLKVPEAPTFDQVAYGLLYVRHFSNYTKAVKAKEIFLWYLNNECETIINQNKINLQLVADYYQKLAGLRLSDDCIRSHAVQDLCEIVFYDLLYQMTIQSVLHCDPNSDEILLFKNILMPRAFEEAHSWIQTERKARYAILPVLIEEKMLEMATKLTFDETIIWLMMHSLRIKNKYIALKMPDFGVGNLSKESVPLFNQRQRAFIEQQELPEHRALARFLYTDQELVNLLINNQ